jgi:hypothetical protein
LALADLLFAAFSSHYRRLIATIVAIAFLGFCTMLTHLRALEWSNQVRFSISEARERPDSPRATYDYARTMVVLTGYHPDSPYTKETIAALEQARRVPNNGILPDQASIMFAAKTGRPLQAEWWQDMRQKLAGRPIGPQELASMGALTKCAIGKGCNFPVADMQAMFRAALSRGSQPEVLNIYGDYALNVLHDNEAALAAWRRCTQLRPGEPQYHVNLVKLLILLGQDKEARAEIAALRRIGKLGQNEVAAAELEQRLRELHRDKAPPGN